MGSTSLTELVEGRMVLSLVTQEWPLPCSYSEHSNLGRAPNIPLIREVVKSRAHQPLTFTTMGWTSRLLLLSLLGIAACQQRSIGSDSRRRNRVPAGKSEVIDFNCPEDFGYYPHPADCTQYYVCVFGGALQESCTGGLMYSHELQACDWPRNVICSLSRQGVSTVRITDPRTSASTPIRPATESLTPSVGSFSGSSFPSQDSQATDLFPVRIQQGGSERGARVFTSSSPSQQSLAQQTIDQLSRFPKTKAL